MNFQKYKVLYKKMSSDYSQSFLATLITYIILFGLISIGLIHWKSDLIIFLYTFLYILIFILHLKAETVERKGEFLLLKFVSYLPIKPANLYFYSYFQRIWFNFLATIEIFIPCIIFYFFGVPIYDIILFFLRIHLLVLNILYLRYVIFLIQRIKNMKIYLKVFAIIILSILPFLPYDNSISLLANLTLYFDFILLVIFFISLFTYRPILNHSLNLTVLSGSEYIINFTKVFSRSIFFPFKLFKNRIYNVISTYYSKIMRDASLNNQYVTILLIMLLFLFITSFTTSRSDLQLINTMSFVLCLNIFHRIKCTYALIEAISPEYIPLKFQTKQLMIDLFHFINVIFIWILLLLMIILQQPFSICTILQGFILLLCYFLTISLFIIPVQHKWYSKEYTLKIKKQSGRKSFILSIFMVFLSFIFERIMYDFPLTFLFILPTLLCFYFFSLNKQVKIEMSSFNYDRP